MSNSSTWRTTFSLANPLTSRFHSHSFMSLAIDSVHVKVRHRKLQPFRRSLYCHWLMTDPVNMTQSSRRDVLCRAFRNLSYSTCICLHKTSAFELVDLLVSVRCLSMLHFASPLDEICKKDRKPHHCAKGDASKPPIS